MGGPVWREEIVATVRPGRGPSIAVVTPWLNHPELEPDYFSAAHPSLNASDELLVVDNGSDEPLSFAAIRHEQPRGFSPACNAGLAHATTDAVLFLNNDIAATRPDWLTAIRDALEPGVLVGAQLRTGQHGDVDGQPCPYLDGWCVAGMRADLIELGGWDEGYAEPSYYGDNDLSLRARAAGMTLREARVGLHHKLSRTADEDPRKAAAAEQNRKRFHERARDLLGVAA
jgi:GT2 family glycosyltransferase